MSIWTNVISQLPKRPNTITTKGVARKTDTLAFLGHRVWGGADLEFLERNYPVMSDSELKKHLNRAQTSIRAQAISMGLTKIFGRNKPPDTLYRDVIERVRAGQSHAMIIMTLFVTQEEIDACIRHWVCTDADR